MVVVVRGSVLVVDVVVLDVAVLDVEVVVVG